MVLEYLYPPEITEYLKKGIRYNFKSGPMQAPDEQTALDRGVNCGALARLLVLRFGFWIPESLGPIEMCLPNSYLRQVRFEEPAEIGDLAFFGPEDIEGLSTELLGNQNAVDLFIKRHPGVPHVAVFICQDNIANEPLYIHASYASRGVDVWPLNKFQEYRDPKGGARYSKLLEHKRPCTFRLAS